MRRVRISRHSLAQLLKRGANPHAVQRCQEVRVRSAIRRRSRRGPGVGVVRIVPMGQVLDTVEVALLLPLEPGQVVRHRSVVVVDEPRGGARCCRELRLELRPCGRIICPTRRDRRVELGGIARPLEGRLSILLTGGVLARRPESARLALVLGCGDAPPSWLLRLSAKIPQ
jgi:hypothetical protein